MAHLNVISVHPFRDGNGRIARIIHSLVLARGGLASPEFFSIEEYLESLAEQRGWPDRIVIALEQSLLGGTDRGKYAEEAGVSPATASADFRRLLDAGLVDRHGLARASSYTASDALRSAVTPGDRAPD